MFLGNSLNVVRVAVLSLVLVGVLTTGVYAFLDPCNSELITQVEGDEDECGEGASCPDDHPNCSGISVTSMPLYSCGGGGTASQRCEVTEIVCTVTLYCKKEGVFEVCKPDGTRPFLDGEGNPVVSKDQGGAMVSCEDQT